MIKDIVDLTELQHMLDEAAGRNIRIKRRTASLDDAQKLLEEGYDIKWISRKSGIPESAIAKYEEEKRVFLSTGRLPSTHRVHTTFSGSSWTNYL
jgi:threonyl-tRNA synthetase